MWRNNNVHSLLVGMQNDTATLGDQSEKRQSEKVTSYVIPIPRCFGKARTTEEVK